MSLEMRRTAPSPCSAFVGSVALALVAVQQSAIAEVPGASQPAASESELGPKWREFTSAYFELPIVRLRGVFTPLEAERSILPFMKDHADLFKGKAVLEIGSGSGINAAYAAALGASRVVATDIDPRAVKSTEENARRLGFASVVDARLVPLDDATAYSVMGEDEKFDIVLSNPPYALNLDAKRNTPVTDTGDLGFSIIRGFDAHVNPGGMQLLYYGSLFYHRLMVKFARYEGFDVRSNDPRLLVPWEAATLFNFYLARFLEYQGLPPDAFSFKGSELEQIRIGSAREPLFPGRQGKPHPGWILIRRPAAP